MENQKFKSYTHVALVLDASGSMQSLRESTVSTMKEFFNSLKSPEDKTVVDLWQFDELVEHVIDGKDIEQGASEAIENYHIGGCTALYDAICIGIDELGRKFAAMKEEERPDAVVFAILTDGFENSSTKFNIREVKERIAHQTEKYSWTFRFLAANQDAVLAGREFGLAADACMDFDATAHGVAESWSCVRDLCCGLVRENARRVRASKSGRIANQ